MSDTSKAEADALAAYRDSFVIDALGGDAKALDSILASGVTAENVTVGQVDKFFVTVKAIADYLLFFDAFSDKTLLIETVDDICRAKREHKLGIILGFQGTAPIEDDFALLSIYHKLGVRIIELTYNESCSVGYSCVEKEDRGLTQFGREVVRELNRLGVVVDLSHVGCRTSLDAIEVSKHPVIFSHSNPKNVCNHNRNITDEQIKAVAAKGGVVCLTSYSIFCETHKGEWPTLEDYATCIDYVVQLVGVDHAGIGTDNWEAKTQADFQKVVVRFWDNFSPYSSLKTRHVQGMQTIQNLPQVAVLLARRGYKPDDITKIFGGNLMRVFDTVWRKNP